MLRCSMSKFAAALLAAYPDRCAICEWLNALVILITFNSWSPPWMACSWIAVLATWYAPTVFVWNMSDSTAGSSVDGDPTVWQMPAALTRMSILPVARMRADMAGKSVTLAACRVTSNSGYFARSVPFASSSLDCVRPTMMMREMPACAKVSQKIRPRPPAVVFVSILKGWIPDMQKGITGLR